MSLPAAWPRIALYLLFALSGFAGLIYESIWSHYLKLFLGHAAYAQTLVLVIFMGGMAIGAWLAGEVSTRLSRPLLWYAGAELLLGLGAFLFDPLFRAMQAWMFDAVIPSLSSPAAIDLAKWSASAAIILPQSVLLGMTFPLMSAGLLRLWPAQSGAALAILYFTNSLGAAAGVLTSGFWLVAAVGLPGTILSAGLINCLLAAAVFLLQRTPVVWQAPAPRLVERAATTENTPVLLLWAAFLTGAASFCYEIAWLRMLSFVLGSATHSFELMLSAFITGLALGSFWIRGRIDRIADRRRWLAAIQIAMGLVALATLPLYLFSFEIMEWLLGTVLRNDSGYGVFVLTSHALCFLLMLPATFCAGMTLPLISAELLATGHGERSIGRVYSANTLGAISGVIAAVHLVMPLTGLRAVLLAGAAIDMLLGFWLLRGVSPVRWQRAGAGAALAAAVLLAVFVRFDPQVTASGVFRSGQAETPGTVVFHADGKTATVDVFRRKDGFTSIATNGKVDAGFMPGGPAFSDDYTMVLTGTLPLAMHDSPDDVAVIGMGSGRTTHSVLLDKRVGSVVTIEIEPNMIEGARRFGAAVERAYTDPRSRFVIEDAKTWFARTTQRYDLIISEPSNPWVSGVASLFSAEFYTQARRRLKEGGLFVQWVQLYEINTTLVYTVLRAVGESFADFAVYSTNHSDMIIVASADGAVPEPGGWQFDDPEFKPLYEAIALRSRDELAVRRLGVAHSLLPMIRWQGVRANSDYFPILDQGAARHVFLKSSATGLIAAQPYSARLDGRPVRPDAWLHITPGLEPTRAAAGAVQIGNFFTGRADGSRTPDEYVARLLGGLELINSSCDPQVIREAWLPSLRELTIDYGAYLSTPAARQFLQYVLGGKCHALLDEQAKQWLDLFAGVAFDDWAQTSAAAGQMLQSNPAGFRNEAFVVAEMLLAEYMIGGRVALQQRVLSLGKRLPDSLPIRMLLGLADDTAGGRATD
jgi:spermidine synthase